MKPWPSERSLKGADVFIAICLATDTSRTLKAFVDLWNYSGARDLLEEKAFIFPRELRIAIIGQNWCLEDFHCLPFGFHSEAACECNVNTCGEIALLRSLKFTCQLLVFTASAAGHFSSCIS